MACSKSHNNLQRGERDMNQDIQDKTGVFQLAYRAKGEGCETGTRIATSRAQLCRNLQIGSQNNNCAEAGRMKVFEERCRGQAWEPATAQAFVQMTSAIVCDVSAPNSYTYSQALTDGSIVIPHLRFFAKFMLEDVNNVKIQILNSYPNGKILSEKNEKLVDKPVSVKYEDKQFSASASCKKVK
jgi:hypothetical protein